LKANRVGDILTVRLVEQTNASKNANTSTSKSSSASIANPVIFGRPVTSDGVPILEGSLGSDTAFDGAGSSSQSNSLRGDITVTVVERYPNGNLLIRGEKWLTLNQGKEFIRLSASVRPYDIELDNSLTAGVGARGASATHSRVCQAACVLTTSSRTTRCCPARSRTRRSLTAARASWRPQTAWGSCRDSFTRC